MGDAGSEEQAVFWQQQINSLGYGAQQMATCLRAKVYVFLTASRCAHHAACGTGLSAEGCEHIPLPRVPAYQSLHLSGELSQRNEPSDCLPHLGFLTCLQIRFHYKVAVLMQRNSSPNLFSACMGTLLLNSSVLVFHNLRLPKGLPVTWRQTRATFGSVQINEIDGSGSSSELSPASSHETWCGEALGLDPGAHADHLPHRNGGSCTPVKLFCFAKSRAGAETVILIFCC